MQHCPLCDADLFPTVKRAGLPLQSCPACGFVAIDLEQWQSPYAGGEYYADLTAPHVDWQRSFLQHRVAGVRRFLPSGYVLELGAGIGETALALAQAGYRVDAVEESPKAVSYLQANHPTVSWHQAEILDYLAHTPDATYDAVTLFHVLEHIPRPHRLAKELSRVVSSGGIAAIELPNLAGLQARLKGERWHYLQAHHVNYFHLGTLQRLMEPHGFELLGHEEKYHFSHPQGVLWKDRIKSLLAKIGFADILCTWWRRSTMR
ncbi:MAG: methyltransferase domain-containing protein [Magnetococcales bacterium]|nr:methyltransferase domain-containing protein [Magnetococcales bacterium]MBF0322502.1 methyltransferase domain-containing protein [Magnetococcales bacterium]